MYTTWRYMIFAFVILSASAFASLPANIEPEGQKKIIVDPKIHRWGAYDEDGKLVKSGMATAGSNYCPDLGRSCRTKVGSYRIESLGDRSCKSRKFPLPRGGAPMPYCMFFNEGQALHGSNAVYAGNGSHGCVRLHVQDARWIRFNFAEEPTGANEQIGTLVVIKPY